MVTVAFSGCTARSVGNDFTLSNEKSEGVVILSVSHDLSGRNANAIFYLDGLPAQGGSTLVSADDAIPGVHRKSEFTDSRGRLLVLALPPGRHVINYWQISNGTGLRIFPKESPPPLEFDVVSGHVKYIGNLHANLQIGKNVFEIPITADGYPEVIDRQARDLPLFESRYPQLKGKVTVDLLPIGPWMLTPETTRKTDLRVVPGTK